MSLEKHIDIFFKDLFIDNKINFYDLWKSIYKNIYPEKNLDFNNIFDVLFCAISGWSPMKGRIFCDFLLRFSVFTDVS